MDRIPLLGKLETAVLDYLWDRGTIDAKQVQRDLGVKRGITLNTIQSTLERLHRKHLAIRERFGHAYQYAPAIPRERFRALAVASVAGPLRGIEGQGVIAAFVELAAKADHRNLDRLESLVAAARARRGAR